MPRMFVVKKQDAIVESEGKKNPGINKNNRLLLGGKETLNIYIYIHLRKVNMFLCLYVCVFV